MKNWQTTLAGIGSMACGTLGAMHILPYKWHEAALHLCAILIGLGLIAARDARNKEGQ